MPLTVAVPVEQYWHRVPGGTARATASTVAELGRRPDLTVRAVAAWHGRRNREPAVTHGGPVTYVPLPRPLLYESWLRLSWPPIERITGPVDVVWAASMIVPPTRAPVVATVHDVDFLDHPERLSARGRTFFPRAWAVVASDAALVACPSQAVADACAARGIGRDRLRVVPWGVGPPISPPADDGAAARRRHDLPSRFVLWVGTLEPRKNVDRLVEAMTQIPDVALAMVGPGGWGLDGDAVVAPLGRRARRLGRVTDAELSALYRAADVVVLPSLHEGFGLPVLEAMAHGTPVVTSRGGATEEVAGGAARLVDPRDPASIAAAIHAALTEETLTAELVARGLRNAANATWAATAAGYAALFDDVAA